MNSNRKQPETGRISTIRNNHEKVVEEIITFIMTTDEPDKLMQAIYSPCQVYLKEKNSWFGPWFIYKFTRVRDKDAKGIIHETSRDSVGRRARLLLLQLLAVEVFPTGGWTTTSINSNILWNILSLMPCYKQTDPDPRKSLSKEEDLTDIGINIFIPEAKKMLETNKVILEFESEKAATSKKPDVAKEAQVAPPRKQQNQAKKTINSNINDVDKSADTQKPDLILTGKAIFEQKIREAKLKEKAEAEPVLFRPTKREFNNKALADLASQSLTSRLGGKKNNAVNVGKVNESDARTKMLLQLFGGAQAEQKNNSSSQSANSLSPAVDSLIACMQEHPCADTKIITSDDEATSLKEEAVIVQDNSPAETAISALPPSEPFTIPDAPPFIPERFFKKAVVKENETTTQPIMTKG